MEENKAKLTGYPSIDKPWLKYYTEEQLSKEFEPMSMYQLMCRENRGKGKDIALSYFGNKISFSKMRENIDKVTKALLQLGVKKGDMVMMSLPNIPEAVYAYYAINRIGAVLNTIDPRTSVDVVKNDILEAKSAFIIILDVIYPKLENVLSELHIEHVVVVSPFISLNSLQRGVMKLKNCKVKSRQHNTFTWNQFIKCGKGYSLELPDEFEEGKPALICHTGGSTGTPKGVILSNESCNALIYQLLYSNMGFQRQERFLNILPPFIALGLINATHLAACAGIESILIPSFEPEEFPQLVMKYKPNILMGGPIHYNILVNSKELENEDLSYIKKCCSGGDKLPKENQIKIQEFLELHNSSARIWIGYGATEMSSGISCMRNDCFRFESVGVPYLHNIFEVFDSDTGEKLKGYNKTGELRVTGPTLMLGYFGAHASETDNVIKMDEEGRRWYYTGDLAHIDEDGLIYIDGRIKRIITRRGFKIYPLYIEELILKHEAVKNCAVVGVEDREEISIPVANIVLKEKYRTKQMEETVKVYVNETIARLLPEYAVMAGFNFLKELPVTPIGKLDFRALEKLGIMGKEDKQLQTKFEVTG